MLGNEEEEEGGGGGGIRKASKVRTVSARLPPFSPKNLSSRVSMVRGEGGGGGGW